MGFIKRLQINNLYQKFLRNIVTMKDNVGFFIEKKLNANIIVLKTRQLKLLEIKEMFYF